MTLFSFAGDHRASKIEIAAQYNGIALGVTDVKDGAEVKAKNPMGKVPVLETADGCIFESNAILRYVARANHASQLYGRCAFEAGQVDQWVDFAANEIDLAACAWVYPILGFSNYNHQATEKAKTDLSNVLSVLDAYLLTRTYLVGNTITLADIAVGTSLLLPFQHVFDGAFAGKFVNVLRWLTTCYNQPEFLAVTGEVSQCKEMKCAKPAAAKKEKKEAPKKQEKKPAAPKKEEKDAAEEAIAAEPKKKQQVFPPTKMEMDEWKRQYSNTDIKTQANPWLWANVDDGYSFWRADFKYNDENTVLFMTANLLGGFMQRMEASRKTAFGNLLIFNDTAPFEITHVWMFRGQDIPDAVQDVPDFESYNWTKLNPQANPADKQLVEDFNLWEGEFGGRKLNQTDSGKTFK